MDYRSIIESRYNRARWQKLLFDIFGNKAQFWQQPQIVPADKNLAKHALYIGKITLPDGHVIAIYEVELTDTVVIERNRAGIRNLLCSNWREMGCSGAFMFCYRENESVLRFSYVSESFVFAEDGSLKKESTNTKRFTYLLGEGHRSRTAIKQFEELKNSKLDLKALTKAFSVEALSDLFFKEYKKRYEDIIEYVTGKRMVKVANKWEERLTGEPCIEIMREFSPFPDAEKAVRDYVKKLMGRLVFIQFLQKKGWMGCPAGKSWGNGDREFVQNLFANTSHKDTFVDDVLEPLFDDINTKREGDLSSSAEVGLGIKIPYLNGGLFEYDEYDETNFPLPAKYMKDMLDFFASYNFTIDENDPDDAEIGVDPEMLGRIFENLLEDNKDKGAFYTPKEIVQYMCRESLIAYLQNDKFSTEGNELIRQFVETFNADSLSDKQRYYLRKKLQDVKICDPAIGSGAFPMGLVNLLSKLYIAMKADTDTAKMKRHIMEQNIYGVDIEKGAIDIARLRFWLAMIVEEKEPMPLPNLHFKIMQGNSLLESYNGIDLSDLTKKASENGVLDFGDDVERQLLVEDLKSYYNTSDHIKRDRLFNEILNNIRRQLYNKDLTFPKGFDPSENNQFFLWHTWFSDVFANGGFDIVIGNPPYIQLQKAVGIKGIDKKGKEYDVKLGDLYVNSKYETFEKTGDIYCLFYELGNRMLKPGGHLCYITSNKWMRAGYGKSLRGYMSKKTNPLVLIDFGGIQIFDNATVDTNILLFEKSKNQNSTKAVTASKHDKNILNNLSDFVQQNGSLSNFDTEDSWVILTPIEQSIKKKIETAGVPLKDWDIQINYGIKTGYNDAFIISTEKREEILANCADEDERARTAELIRPILRGRDIKRYSYDWADLWLINTHNGIKGKLERIHIEDYPAVKAHLDQYWDKISVRSDKGDTPYNLRNCVYLEDFSQPKIVYPEIAYDMEATIVPANWMINNKCYMISSNDIPLEVLCAFLNTKIFSKIIMSKVNFGGGKGVEFLGNVAFPQNIDFNLCKSLSTEEYESYFGDLLGLTPEELQFLNT